MKKEQPKIAKKLETFLQSFYVYFIFTLTFFISGFIINVLQIILHLTVKRYNIHLFRKINYYLCYTFYNHMTFLAEWYADIEILLYVDEKDKKYLGKEHAYTILNHKYEIDWLVYGFLMSKFNISGNYKAYIKKVLQYVPAIGWCLYLSENIFLERSFKNDKLIIHKQISKLLDYQDPIWLLMYPEGTRYTPEKYEASLKVAKEKGLPQLQNLLTPRTKGFVTSLLPMKGKMGAIYDMVITFDPDPKTQPTVDRVLRAKKIQAHIYLRRIPFEDVPGDEIEATQFLHDMFVRKDKLHSSFLATGDYFATSDVPKLSPVRMKKSWIGFVNHIVWVTAVMGTVAYYLINLLFTATLYRIVIVYGVLFLFSLVLSRCFAFSQIKKGSSYGKETSR